MGEATVDVRREIAALARFEGRRPGSDAERRAAGHLAARLRDAGRDAALEPVETWPRWPVAQALHAFVAIAGSVAAVSAPVVGSALVLAATLLTFGEGTGVVPLTRRLLGRRASQNVISREDDGAPGTLVLVAHHDAGQLGAIFNRPVEERRAALGRLLRRPIGRLEPLAWAMVAILGCCVLRLVGVEGKILNVVQFVPTAALIVALPLLVDVALSSTSPGANDNASGVALALELARRHGGGLEHFDLWLLLTGAEESLADGMRSFLRRHKRSLDVSRTVFLNLEEVGAGTVRYTTREGAPPSVRTHVQLVELCEQIAEDDEDAAFGARALVDRRPSDAARVRLAGYPALTITCRNALDYVPEHHQPTDVPDRIDDAALERALGFCSELIERIDAQLGPALSEPE